MKRDGDCKHRPKLTLKNFLFSTKPILDKGEPICAKCHKRICYKHDERGRYEGIYIFLKRGMSIFTIIEVSCLDAFIFRHYQIQDNELMTAFFKSSVLTLLLFFNVQIVLKIVELIFFQYEEVKDGSITEELVTEDGEIAGGCLISAIVLGVIYLAILGFFIYLLVSFLK